MMSTEWLEVSVRVSAELAEAVAEVLSRFVRQGVVIEAGPEGTSSGPVTVYAYLPNDDAISATRRKVEEAVWHLGQIAPIPDPVFREVAEADWAEEWKKHLRVLHIGQRVVIRPTWLPYQPKQDEMVIQLDPGMAFGTGLHPTTQLCLIALESHVSPGMQLLDLGTGSGILAIAGVKLGAGTAIALDNDPQAITVAKQNIRLNAVAEQVLASTGSLADAEGEFDLVVVNIVAKVIVQMAQDGLERLLAPNGVLIAAGLIVDQEQEITDAFTQAGLQILARHQMEDWIALEARRAS